MDGEALGQIGGPSPGTVNRDPIAQGAERDVGDLALDRALDHVAARAAALARCDRDHFMCADEQPTAALRRYLKECLGCICQEAVRTGRGRGLDDPMLLRSVATQELLLLAARMMHHERTESGGFIEAVSTLAAREAFLRTAAAACDTIDAIEAKPANDEPHANGMAAAADAADCKQGEEPRSLLAWSAGEAASALGAAHGMIKAEAQHLPAMADSNAAVARAEPSATKFPGTDPARRAKPARGCEITPPVRDEAIAPIVHRHARGPLFGVLAGTLVAALGFWWIGGSSIYRLFNEDGHGLSGKPAVNAVVERIIQVESGGDPNARNARSSAIGAGQFLDETWLELIRAHRGDLTRGRSEREILELRRDPELCREITARFVERNAAILSRRGLPVTPGTLYLAHFAGPAGAVAILSVPDDADAASLLANADTTGRTTRRKIVAANPFLENFTVADLKSWAERKMRDPGL
jgi:hypothetical protein